MQLAAITAVRQTPAVAIITAWPITSLASFILVLNPPKYIINSRDTEHTDSVSSKLLNCILPGPSTPNKIPMNININRDGIGSLEAILYDARQVIVAIPTSSKWNINPHWVLVLSNLISVYIEYYIILKIDLICTI